MTTREKMTTAERALWLDENRAAIRTTEDAFYAAKRTIENLLRDTRSMLRNRRYEIEHKIFVDHETLTREEYIEYAEIIESITKIDLAIEQYQDGWQALNRGLENVLTTTSTIRTMYETRASIELAEETGDAQEVN